VARARSEARYDPGEAARSLALAVGALAAALLAAGVIPYLITSPLSTKWVAAAIGGALWLLGAAVSGNPRLYCLWWLALTIPFSLSKRLGSIIMKMGGENSIQIEIGEVFVGLLALFLLRDLWLGHITRLRVPRVLLPWLAIMLLGLLAVVVGPYRTTAVHELFRMLKVMLLFLILCNELTRPSRILQFATALSASAALQSAAGLFQYVTRRHLGLDILGETGSGTLKQLAKDSLESDQAFRIGAFLGHPNIFGPFLAVLLPLAAVLFVLPGSRARRGLGLVTLGLGMAALIGTLSRSGWVAFFTAFTVLVILMLMHRGLSRRVLLPVSAASLALGLVCAMFIGQIMTRILESKEDAITGRAEYTATARRMIALKPVLGWGLNSYVYVAPPFTSYGARGAAYVYKGWLPPVHNIYLLWWAETGIVGLLLHLALLAWLARIAISNLKIRDGTLFAISAALVAALAAFLVDGFFSFTLRINAMLRVFWILSALILAIRYLRLAELAKASQPALPGPLGAADRRG
jgi:O-antigen ligase